MVTSISYLPVEQSHSDLSSLEFKTEESIEISEYNTYIVTLVSSFPLT